jgi:alpha-1,2-mannosyltransferase
MAGKSTLTAGCLIGAICLVKPQFSLFLLWAGIRRQTYFAAGQVTILVFGSFLSLALYGFDDNLKYFDVLSYLSQHGETYWDNTSVNGLVSGIIHPNLSFSRDFPPFDLVTYFLTMGSSIAIVALALLANRKSSSAGGLLDFITAGLCFTLAAPIAWGHHYGVVMPMLAVGFIEVVLRADLSRRGPLLAIWGACFLLFSVNWNVTEAPVGVALTFLLSWRLVAAIGLIWLMFDLESNRASMSGRADPIAAAFNSPWRHRIRSR